jgi:hypothetical protein
MPTLSYQLLRSTGTVVSSSDMMVDPETLLSDVMWDSVAATAKSIVCRVYERLAGEAGVH